MTFDEDIESISARDQDPHHPGTSGIWTFIFIDMVIFALFFVIFVSERHRLPTIFTSSQTALNPLVGLLGTLLLLTSSWCVAESVQAIRTGTIKKAKQQLDLAALLGLGFVVNKLFEYGEKFSHGLSPVTNGFFTFYFLITGLHLLHVVGGLCFLGHCRLRIGAEAGSPGFRKKLENTGLFWHFVDMLWLFIFPMLYLTGVT
jgi:nitric oxide reductase NorE protein